VTEFLWVEGIYGGHLPTSRPPRLTLLQVDAAVHHFGLPHSGPRAPYAVSYPDAVDSSMVLIDKSKAMAGLCLQVRERCRGVLGLGAEGRLSLDGHRIPSAISASTFGWGHLTHGRASIRDGVQTSLNSTQKRHAWSLDTPPKRSSTRVPCKEAAVVKSQLKAHTTTLSPGNLHACPCARHGRYHSPGLTCSAPNSAV
jgi:hypothetical protein